MRIFVRLLCPVLLILVAAIALADPAQARSLEIERFDVRIDVRKDGTVAVEERIQVRFHGSYSGIFRWIPYGYTYPNGLRNQLHMKLDAVEDVSGNALKHWTKRSRGRLEVKIAVPGANNAVQTVVLRYRAWDVIRLQRGKDESYGAYDELYWNVTGNDWVAPINVATAEVHLPDAIDSDRIRTGAFTGKYGARGTGWTVDAPAAHTVRYSTTEMLLPGAGLTIAVTFPPGHVARPTLWQRILWWISANWYALIPTLAFLLWLVIWRMFGRDAMAGRTIIPDWRAPEGLRPSEVGILADDQLDPRDLTAAIVDLAVRGVITIEELEKDWELTLHPEKRDAEELSGFEKKLLAGLFRGDKTTVRMKTLKHKFFKDLKGIRSGVLTDLVTKGLFEKRPDKVMERWFGLTLLAVGIMAVVGFRADVTWLYWAILVPAALGMFIIAKQMPRRTRKGLDALARVRGLEEYIVTAEAERMKDLPMVHFDQVLPFAIALGLHDRWAEAFDGIYEQEPTWYRSRDGRLDSWMIARGVGGMDRGVGNNLLAAPRSQGGTGGRSWGGGWSGGGGFSGGSSGGGFGGGGGGGW